MKVASLKHSEHLALTRVIKSVGSEILTCSRYERSSRKCIVEPRKSSQCSKYIRASSIYNVNYLPSVSEQEAVDSQIKRLESQEKEAFAKIQRLRKQKALLRQCKKEMLRRGLQTLDKLDTQERKEKKEEERAYQEETDCLLSQSVKDPYPDYDPTLTARLINLPADDPLQLSDFDPYTLPIGYDSYTTLDSALVIPGSHSRTPLASQGS